LRCVLVPRYVAPEVMEGDNQYNAEGFGKVDADRFVRFATLPPVLHLQLKRFEFNMQTYSFDKVREVKVHCPPVASPLFPSYSASYFCGSGGVLRAPPPPFPTRHFFFLPPGQHRVQLPPRV
jgi:hypothetical protein